MFTGIVEEMGKVEAVETGRLTIRASKVMGDLKSGGSVSVNGVCLTVTSLTNVTFSVDVVPETLRRTNLGTLMTGLFVNLERPLLASGRLDGHIVQGHVDGTGAIETINEEGTAKLITIHAPQAIARYIVEKGFIAVDGISLTIVNCSTDRFVVSMIPFTTNNTVFRSRKVRDLVNLEVDVIAKYVERLT